MVSKHHIVEILFHEDKDICLVGYGVDVDFQSKQYFTTLDK